MRCRFYRLLNIYKHFVKLVSSVIEINYNYLCIIYLEIYVCVYFRLKAWTNFFLDKICLFVHFSTKYIITIIFIFNYN